MGALHAGHLSLIDYARANCGCLVVSIFVNPLQFNDPDDLANYPDTWEADLSLCAGHQVDLIYAPKPDDMYPSGFQTKVTVEKVSQGLCGDFRPGHFDGVSTVVLKLFNVTRPHLAVFGEKDFQQLRLIQRMALDLDLGIEVVGRPIVREPDGLAMSSRNQHLSPDERQQALCLCRGLNQAHQAALEGERNAAALIGAARAEMEGTPGVRVEYVEVVDTQTLERLQDIDRPARMCVAAWVGETRLIDNLALN
jgi:pantoate--beta-alanine ligase